MGTRQHKVVVVMIMIAITNYDDYYYDDNGGDSGENDDDDYQVVMPDCGRAIACSSVYSFAQTTLMNLIRDPMYSHKDQLNSTECNHFYSSWLA